jgi:hypothetical protein
MAVENVLVTPLAYHQDELAWYKGIKGQSATSDGNQLLNTVFFGDVWNWRVFA